MPLPRVKASGATTVTKTDAGNDSVDTLIKQATGKQPFLSFSKTNEGPVQWVQLLNALDQQDLPGWPLLSPLKIQLQKCSKCSQEFYSSINYRRHMRLHRRNLNLDKDSTTKNRVLLQAFWDKLSVDEAMKIMSFEDVCLEGVSGSLIINELMSLIQKPGFTSLPLNYIGAGSALLDIIQGRRSRFPASSQDFFSILDVASERTFLCAGTAESLQKYVFDGEAGKIGLEMKNLVACTSFLIEQKVVKACLADKDAEALRYQKLLVEEEESALKRQAALLEKKRQKKLRQKEQRAKDHTSGETDDLPNERSPSPPASSPAETFAFSLEKSAVPHNTVSSLESIQILNLEGSIDKNHDDGYHDLGTCQNVEHTMLQSDHKHVSYRWHAPKSLKIASGYHMNHNHQVSKPGSMQKHVSYRNHHVASGANGSKVWTPKPKADADGEFCDTRLQVHTENLCNQDKKSEVLIGSLSVTLGNCSSWEHNENHGGHPRSCALDPSMPRGNLTHEKPNKTETTTNVRSCSTVEHWKPLSRLNNGGQLPVQSCDDHSEVCSLPSDNSNIVQLVFPADDNFSGREENPDSSVECGHQGGLRFSSQDAEAFLAKRWKEVIASDHVQLTLFPEHRSPPQCPEVQDDHQEVQSSKQDQHRVLASTENRLTDPTKKSMSKARAKKRGKVRYIPKQRSVT